jgi:hypothetical protein
VVFFGMLLKHLATRAAFLFNICRSLLRSYGLIYSNLKSIDKRNCPSHKWHQFELPNTLVNT